MEHIAQPQISEEEISLVAQTIRSGSFVEGENARTLEKEFAKFVGAKHAICAVNGTAALHLAIEGLNIPPGVEMITSAFTFIASANVITFGGGIPIFADIDPNTFNIDPEKIKKAITPKTRCILPIHIFGLPADMKAISEIATEHDLMIIEDACQAHGGYVDKKHVGTFGDVGCFSFYATKNMITGEGGMVVTNDDELAERIRSLKNHGRGAKGGYHHHLIAYNYRLPDPLAAIGLIQLRKLPRMLEQRRKNAELIRETIAELEPLKAQTIPRGFTHAHYVCAPIIENPGISVNKVISDLRNRGIGSRQIYSIPCHQQPTYLEGIRNWRWNKFVDYPDYSLVRLPVSEKVASSHFEIPIHPGITNDEVMTIQKTLIEIFA
ncbi:MAG: DegT/DnrJ/EryC1/StrS family aminotransferase [Candidatus Heimdallarchaeota archaeon]|nr:MAG: DegT/DnrJ/EryC1/StrS family aminotransferase [Candidatus Heimdallarchaeota archaeon]